MNNGGSSVFHHQHNLPVITNQQHSSSLSSTSSASSISSSSSITSPSSNMHHKMSGGIRRTVSSATPSHGGMGSINGSNVSSRSTVSASSITVKSLSSSNTQSSAVSSRVSNLNKDPHKKLDRSFSEPAEKKNSTSNGNSSTSQIGPSSRYKTELCRSFQEVGSCKYGDKCQFAHGEEELRTVTRHPKFKTENCKSFHSTGFCPYGPRCHFIHNKEEHKKTLHPIMSGGNNVSNMSSTPAVIGQRLFDNQLVPASGLLVSGSPISPPAVSAGSVLQSSNFPITKNPLNHHNHPNMVNLVRPKALSLGSYSLGSSGEISSPSSQSGSPTSLNSFFTEDNFGLVTPFSSSHSRGLNHLSTAVMNAFQSTNSGSSSSTFSFSPDSAFVSFTGAHNGSSSSSSSNTGSSLSFGTNTTQKCFFGGSQPTLNSRFSPEPLSAINANQQDETAANSVAINSVFSLFGNEPNTSTTLDDFLRCMSPVGCNKSSQLLPTYPSSPESPVDSVASEIEALKLGEFHNHHQQHNHHSTATMTGGMSTSFSPISTSSSLSTSSSSPSNGMVDLVDTAFIFPSSGVQCSASSNNIPSSRLPIFTKLANHVTTTVNGHN